MIRTRRRGFGRGDEDSDEETRIRTRRRGFGRQDEDSEARKEVDVTVSQKMVSRGMAYLGRRRLDWRWGWRVYKRERKTIGVFTKLCNGSQVGSGVVVVCEKFGAGKTWTRRLMKATPGKSRGGNAVSRGGTCTLSGESGWAMGRADTLEQHTDHYFE